METAASQMRSSRHGPNIRAAHCVLGPLFNCWFDTVLMVIEMLEPDFTLKKPVLKPELEDNWRILVVIEMPRPGCRPRQARVCGTPSLNCYWFTH